MKRRRRLIAVILAFILAFGVNMTADAASKPMAGDIVVIHTNDTHGRAVEAGTVGISGVAALKKQYEEKGAQVLLIDAGDTLHGLPFATLDKGLSIVKLMNQAGYDVMVPGNHDFNYGYTRLKELQKSMNFKFLASNFVSKDKKEAPFENYTIITKGGKRFGFFGLCTPETVYKTSPKNVEGYEFLNPIDTAKQMVEVLKSKGVDYVVAVGHIGVDGSSEFTSEKIINAVDGIDLFVDGHSHTVFETGEQVKDTLIVSTGQYYDNVGVVTIKSTGEMKAKLVHKADASKLKDSAMEAKIAQIQESNRPMLEKVIAKTAVDLDGERVNNRAKETNFGNLTADAMREATGADVAFENGGGIRASIPTGDITQEQIITVFPFGNYVVTLDVKGRLIKQALEVSVASAPDLSGGFLQVSGITFTYDQNKEVGNKVSDIKINGQRIVLNKKYKVACNDFTKVGGDNYTMFADLPVTGEYSALEEIVANYLTKHPELKPAVEGRITVIPLEKTEQEEVVTPVVAKKAA